MTATASTCQALNRHNEPCNAAAGKDGFCYFHSPARAVDRLKSTSAGGKARHNRTLAPSEPVKAKTTADVLTILEQAIGDALALENSLARARTIGYLALATLKTIEVNEFDARLAALEIALKARDE